MKEKDIQFLYDKIELLEFKQELLLELLENDRHLSSLSRSRLEGFLIKHNLTRRQHNELKEFTNNIYKEFNELQLKPTLFGRVRVANIPSEKVDSLINQEEYEHHLREIIDECDSKEVCKEVARITGLYDYLYGETRVQINELRKRNTHDEDNKEEIKNSEIKRVEIEDNEGTNEEVNEPIETGYFVLEFDELRSEFKENYKRANDLLETFHSKGLTSITKFYDEGFEAIEQEQSIKSMKTTRDAINENKFRLEHYGIIEIINHSDQDDTEFKDLMEYIFETRERDHATNITYVVETYHLMDTLNSINQLSVSDVERIKERLGTSIKILDEVRDNLRQ